MFYKVLFETNFGLFIFLWRGAEYVEIFEAENSDPQLVNPFNYETGMLPFRRDLASFADYCRWHLWEMERGIEIFSIRQEEVSRIRAERQGNESPS